MRKAERELGRQTGGNQIEQQLMRRTQEGNQLLEGVFALSPASSQNAGQNLLDACAVPGAVTAPRFYGPRPGSEYLLLRCCWWRAIRESRET